MKLASVMPVWYVAFWFSLTAGVCAFGYFVGPHIIAKGIELWMKGNGK